MTNKTDRHITAHLKVSEIACRCGCGFGTKDGDFSIKTAKIFEQIRKAVSKTTGRPTPISISSGNRCPKRNTEIGGVPNSRHIYGDALDLICPDTIHYDDFYDICDRLVGTKGGVGYYNSKRIVHIDTRGSCVRWLA